MQQAAPANGDFITPTLIGAEEFDFAERDLRYTKAMFQLLVDDKEFADHNKEILQEWLEDWVPRCIARRPHAAAAVVAARREAAALRGRSRPREEPVRRHPVRTGTASTEGAGPVTTFKTAESPFKSDNTASNMCGFTLMNNQVGAIIAEVMGTRRT